MTGKVKLNKIEIFLIVLTVVAVAFTCGYFIGRGGMSKNVTVKVAEEVSANNTATVREDAEDSGANVKASADKSSDSNKPSVPAGKVNINTASAEDLQTLPTIGEVLSERIIGYREENGGFKTEEDIVNVYGIGTSIYEKIKDHITV